MPCLGPRPLLLYTVEDVLPSPTWRAARCLVAPRTDFVSSTGHSRGRPHPSHRRPHPSHRCSPLIRSYPNRLPDLICRCL